jgi:hypothetical protein
MRNEDEAGTLLTVTSVTGAEWFSANIDAPTTMFDGLFEESAVTHVVVAPGVDVRRLTVSIVSAIAAGATCLGYFAPTRPRKVWYLSASAEAYTEQMRFRQHLKTLDAPARQLVTNNLTIYQPSFHRELTPVEIEKEEGRQALTASMPEGTDCVVIDDIVALMAKGHLDRLARQSVVEWIRSFAHGGVAVIYMQRTTPNQRLNEVDERNTVYIEPDLTAPTEFGGGCLVQRGRLDDADHLPKTVGCWWTIMSGELEWTYYVPDLSGSDLRTMKRREFDLKVTMMKLHGATGRQMATILETNETAVSRAMSRFAQMEGLATAALRAAPEESERWRTLIAAQRHAAAGEPKH